MDAREFDAVFFPGGHGTMWDLPYDACVTRAVEAAFAAGKFIASVCHGGAGLVTARRPDGEPVVVSRAAGADQGPQQAPCTARIAARPGGAELANRMWASPAASAL